MDKNIIQQVRRSISVPSKNASCEKSLPANIDHYLGKSKVDFLTKYNPSTSTQLLSFTPGKVAKLPNVPRLCDVATKWGDGIAVSWIEILLTNIEEKQGNSVFTPEAKKDTARTLYSYYRDMNLAEFLLFLGWYKLGKFQDTYSGGLERISFAFSKYRELRDIELERIEREQEYERMEREREKWREKAITYEEYQKHLNK